MTGTDSTGVGGRSLSPDSPVAPSNSNRQRSRVQKCSRTILGVGSGTLHVLDIRRSRTEMNGARYSPSMLHQKIIDEPLMLAVHRGLLRASHDLGPGRKPHMLRRP